MQSNREVNHPKIPLDRNARLIPVLNMVSCNLCSNDRGAMVYFYDVDDSDLLLRCDLWAYNTKVRDKPTKMLKRFGKNGQSHWGRIMV